MADGCKYGQTSERKRFVDFQSFLLQVIFPEALQRRVQTLILILDNGPTHAPKRLEKWLQEQVRLNNWSLTIKVLWLPTNASWLDQIEIWFSVLQRKLLTPNHFHSLEELKQSIMEFISILYRKSKVALAHLQTNIQENLVCTRFGRAYGVNPQGTA